MTSGFISKELRVMAMRIALEKHLDRDSLDRSDKRHAAYIIENVPPEDCAKLDAMAYRYEKARRGVMRLSKASLLD